MNNLTSPLFHPEQPPSDPPPPDIGPDIPVEPPADGDGPPESEPPDIDVTPEPPQEEPPAAGPPGFFDPDRMLADMDAAHKDATRRNQSDWADSPSQQATNQHFIDMRFGQRKREIGELRDQLGAYLADWLGTPQPNGEFRTHRPPFRIWTMLSNDQRRAVDGFLTHNAIASRETTNRWAEAERRGRLARSNPAVYRPDEGSLPADLLQEIQDVKENRQRSLEAEKRYIEEQRRLDPRARVFSQVRIYIPGSPTYMVADVLITGGGSMRVAIVEIKTGDAKLTPQQVDHITKALKSGEVYFVRESIGKSEGPNDPRPLPRVTLAEQHIIPDVYILGGDQEVIKRQLAEKRIEYNRSGNGRMGRARGGGFVP